MSYVLLVYVDMATPALTRFGSEELKQQYLAPSIAGDVLSCIGVSEVSGGSDVASIKTTALPKRGMCVCVRACIFACDVHVCVTELVDIM